MKKNNIYMYKPNLKTKFRRSLAKKNQTYTEEKSTTVASSCLVRLSTLLHSILVSIHDSLFFLRSLLPSLPRK